ncbi:hypothetical protein ACET3Z_025345 [Daucus carota]
MSAILSSTCPTLLISFITSRVGDSSIPSDVDLPFSTLEEPLSSGPQEPITQSIMDTTPPNTEIDQGTTAFIAIEDKPDVSVSLAVTSSPAVVVPTVVFTQTDSIVSTKVAVTSTQHLHEDVILEDDSDDEDVPISSLFNVHSLPSSLLDSSTAHTHATRLSEEGLEHVQRAIEGATLTKALGLESSTVRSDEITLKHTESVRSQTDFRPKSPPPHLKRLRTSVPTIQASSRLSSLKEKIVVLRDKLDSLSPSVADGFSKIQAALDSFSILLHAANLLKGEKSARSNKEDSDQPL